MRKTPLHRKSKSPVSKLQEKCDDLLTPIIKLTTPHCEACGNPTQVAHHWIEKSRSNFLRYRFDNLIGLCHSCHAKIHNRFGNSVTGALDVAEIIIRKRGEDWRLQLAYLTRMEQRVNVAYYQAKLDELKNHLTSISS